MHARVERLHRVIRLPRPLAADRHARLPRTVELELPDALLGRVEVAGVARAVVDEDVGLDGALHVDHARAAPHVELLRHVVPEAEERTVVHEQLAGLRLHVVRVAVEVVRGARRLAAGTGEREVGMVPVAGGVVRPERETGAPTGVGELLRHVAPERRVHDVVVRLLRVPQAEAVVVLRREDDVLHAGRLGDGHPLVGVELHGVEALVEVVVLLHRRLASARPADLLARERHGAPVDEHAEAQVAPPFHRLGPRRNRALHERREVARVLHALPRGTITSCRRHNAKNHQTLSHFTISLF